MTANKNKLHTGDMVVAAEDQFKRTTLKCGERRMIQINRGQMMEVTKIRPGTIVTTRFYGRPQGEKSSCWVEVNYRQPSREINWLRSPLRQVPANPQSQQSVSVEQRV